MSSEGFPPDFFCHSIVRFLDAIEYHDDNLVQVERVQGAHYIHSKTAKFFTQPLPRAMLKRVEPAQVVGVMQSISRFVTCCWPRVPWDVQANITIFFVVANLFDDSVDRDPSIEMNSFWTDLIQGKEQKHPFWLLMNAHLPQLLGSYGDFCAFNIMRSTFDFFEGCWIEHHHFHGYPGSDSFPLFLRRLTSLSGAVGGTLFPASEFSEQKFFKEITCVMAQIEGPETLINDLLSFYKEHTQNEVNLISSRCAVDGITIEQGLERLTDETIHATTRILDILKDKDPKILDTVRAFIHGYVTWHFSEPRYRLREIYEKRDIGDMDEATVKFRHYLEKASSMGWVELGR